MKFAVVAVSGNPNILQHWGFVANGDPSHSLRDHVPAPGRSFEVFCNDGATWFDLINQQDGAVLVRGSAKVYSENEKMYTHTLCGSALLYIVSENRDSQETFSFYLKEKN